MAAGLILAPTPRGLGGRPTVRSGPHDSRGRLPASAGPLHELYLHFPHPVYKNATDDGRRGDRSRPRREPWTPIHRANTVKHYSVAPEGNAEPNESTVTPAAALRGLAETHDQRLRAAGNVTVNRSIAVGNGLERRDQYRVGVGTGEVYHAESDYYDSEFTTWYFRTAEGYVYTRSEFDDSDNYASRPSEELNATGVVTLSSPVEGNESAYERRGERTVDNTTVTRYATSGVSRAHVGSIDGVNRSDVVSYRNTIAVTEAGYVHNETLSYVVRDDGENETLRIRSEYDHVGETAVEEPSWLETATERAGYPPRFATVERTDTDDGEDGLVELTIRAEKGELAAEDPGLGGSNNALYRSEALDEARVGSIVDADFAVSSAESVTLRFHYDDDAIHEANESQLAIATRNSTDGFWDFFDSTVDPEENVVQTTITDADALSQYRYRTFLAMDVERFFDNFD